MFEKIRKFLEKHTKFNTYKLDKEPNEPKYLIGIDLATKCIEDPKVKLQKKLQLIARRTKSPRIRRKNIKRLVSLFETY